jgi:hypothetical protein
MIKPFGANVSDSLRAITCCNEDTVDDFVTLHVFQQLQTDPMVLIGMKVFNKRTAGFKSVGIHEVRGTGHCWSLFEAINDITDLI